MFACRPPTGRLQAHGAGASQPSSAPFATSSTGARAAKSAAAAAAAAAADSGMRDCQSAQPNSSSSSSSSAPWSVAAATSSGAVAASAPVSAGRGTTSSLRVAKDLIELGRDKMTAAASTRISFPDGQKNLRRLQVLLTPHSGLYAHASFLFTLIIPPQYPFQPPNVRCHTPCLHPNINWRTGKVYLHLLKAEWKPVLSINTVLFALQLLFLEPWPQSASAHSATASSMPPARPTLTAAHSASVVPTSDSSQATPSALSLAASRSAAASSLHQLDEGGILNLDIYRLIVGGERAVFEELVRKTLDGGFFFGALWPRNRAAQHDSDSEGEDNDDGDSDDERERCRCVRSPSPVDESRYDPRHMFSSGGGDDSASGFNALLQRVEQNGRQAHVGAVDSQQKPQQQRQFHQRDRRRASRDDQAMDSDSDGHSGAANGAVAPALKLQSQPNGSKGLQKRCKRLLHRKRAHRLISSSDAHEHNPAASLCASSPSTRMLLPGADAADLPTHVHKRIRSQQLALEEQPTAAAGASTTLRVASTSRRRFIQLRPLHVTAGSSGRAAATRKRPSPVPASLSDGEYEDTAEAEVAAATALVAPRRNPSPTAAQDDSSAVPRRRRAKKQFRPAASEDDPFGMDATSSAAAANGRPRPSSTVLPDLASFASFHPTSPPLPLGRSVSPPHATAVASLSDGAQSSNSPKRNVSDCGSLMPALLTLDERGAGASFILHGRSSSRSLNLFGSGPVKAQVAHAGAGLADLQDLQASLPAAAPSAMAD